MGFVRFKLKRRHRQSCEAVEGNESEAVVAADAPLVGALRGGAFFPVVDVEVGAVVAVEGPLDSGLVAAMNVRLPQQGDEVVVGRVAVTLETTAGLRRSAEDGQGMELGVSKGHGRMGAAECRGGF